MDTLDSLRLTAAGLASDVEFTLAVAAYGLPQHTKLRLHRNGTTLELVVEGPGDVAWVNTLLPERPAGELADPPQLELSTSPWGEIVIQLNGSRGTRRHTDGQGQQRFEARLGVREARWRPSDRSAATWGCAVLAGAPQTDRFHQVWAHTSEYPVTRREVIEQQELRIEMSSGSDRMKGDHTKLHIGTHFEGAVRLGTFLASETSIPAPGFLSFAGEQIPASDDPLLHGSVRALWLIFGAAPAWVVWLTRDAAGELCSWTLRSDYAPAPEAGPRSLSKWTDSGLPYAIGPEALSRALRAYLERREALALDRVAWIASHGRAGPIDRCGAALRAAIETLVEAAAPEKLTRVLPKAQGRELRKALKPVLAEQCDGHSVEAEHRSQLERNLSQINRVPLSAQVRLVAESAGVPFGEVENDAWKFANDCAHANPAALDSDPAALFRLRALEGTFARLVVAVAQLGTHYIDYGSLGFPVRPLDEPVGGPNGSEANIVRHRAGK